MIRFGLITTALLAALLPVGGAYAAPPVSEWSRVEGRYQPKDGADRLQTVVFSTPASRAFFEPRADGTSANRQTRREIGIRFSVPPLEPRPQFLATPHLLSGGVRGIMFSQPSDEYITLKAVFADPPIPAPPSEITGGDSPSGKKAPDEGIIGEKPPETTANIQFLRQDSILLQPGEYQFDVTLQYQIDEVDFVLASISGNTLTIGEARTRQRLMFLPIEFRIGLCEDVQGFINVPFGWSNTESIFGTTNTFSNTVGIGDISAGLTRLIYQSETGGPQILWNWAFSAPTGEASIATSLLTPWRPLGEGTWSSTSGLTWIQVFDPLVVFYGFGYRHRFRRKIDGFKVRPGGQLYYRFGLGFAVNSKLTLSGSFIGSFIGQSKINRVSISGSQREPASIRFAATIVRGKTGRPGRTVRTIEPFINFGITESAVDMLFGVSCTY